MSLEQFLRGMAGMRGNDNIRRLHTAAHFICAYYFRGRLCRPDISLQIAHMLHTDIFKYLKYVAVMATSTEDQKHREDLKLSEIRYYFDIDLLESYEAFKAFDVIHSTCTLWDRPTAEAEEKCKRRYQEMIDRYDAETNDHLFSEHEGIGIAHLDPEKYKIRKHSVWLERLGDILSQASDVGLVMKDGIDEDNSDAY